MKNLRIVKITNKVDNKSFYQIQKYSRFFGWLDYGSRSTGEKSSFDTLKEANIYYDAYSGGSLFNIEVIK